MISSRGKVFRDPIHGLIRIEAGDDFVLALIDTPEFQRLRRVRQLGVSSLTYPGAEHTRFAHSLGVFNFAQRILAMLQRRYAGEANVLELLTKQARVIKAAALLHDTGHAPFSHILERAFPSLAEHEKTTVLLLTKQGSLPAVLEKHEIQPESVASLITRTGDYRFLADIISSQLDADRMDYILRDALNTGVKYGAFDAEWVLNNLCLGLEPNVGSKELNDLRLCLDCERGLFSAEQIVVARMHMSYQVYFHRVTRGWEAHMLCLLRLAHDLAAEKKLPQQTATTLVQFFETKGNLSAEDWLSFDDSAIEASFHLWASLKEPEELAALSRAFLLRQKIFNYAELGRLRVEHTFRLSQELKNIGRENIDWMVDDPPFSSYKDFGSGLRISSVQKDEAVESTRAILLSSGLLTDRAQPAENLSRVLNALGDNPEGTRVSLCRLYFNQNLTDKVSKILAQMDIKVHKR